MLSPDDFINVIMKITSLPEETFRTNLLNAIQFSDPGVSSTFFPGQPAQPYLTYEKDTYDGVLKELAVKYVSFVMTTYTSCGFNTCIQNVNSDSISVWFDKNSNTVGQSMLIDYMMQPAQLGNYFTDPKVTPMQWAAKIATEIGTPGYFERLMAFCDTAHSMLPAKIILVMLTVMDHDGPAFLKVQQAWAGNSRWNEVSDYYTYSWLDEEEASFLQGGESYNTINQAVSRACSATQIENYTVTKPCYKMEECGHDYHTKTTYGIDVVNWLNSANGPVLYGYRSAASPSNVTDVITGNCCVAAGTPVLLADGSFKPIELIEEGDKIMGGGGIVSVSSGELYIKDQMTQLYSFNEDEPFMSFEHAVMTQRGWCSLAPGLSMEHTPHHSVKYLSKGDVVWKLKNITDGKIEYEKILVERINIKIITDGSGPAGYGLHLRGGHPSFHVHGYCCLVRYPEITAQYITSNILSEMSFAEQLKFRKQLEEFSPLLGMALGDDVMTSVKKALKNPKQVAAKAQHTNKEGIRKKLIRGTPYLHQPKLKITLKTEQNDLPGLPSEMALFKGHLFVNGALAETHCDENHVYWSRKVNNGTDEKGALRMLSHGMIGHGVVQQGNKNISFTAEGMSSYSTTYGPLKKSWFELDKSSQMDANGNSYVVTELSSPGNAKLDAALKKNSTVVLSITEKKDLPPFLHADIEFDPSYCAFGGSEFIAAEIDFSTLQTSFSGKLYSYDPSKAGYRGASQEINGTLKEPAGFEALKIMLTDKQLKDPVNTSFLSLSHQDKVIPDSLLAAKSLSPLIDHRVEELYNIAAPNMVNLHQNSFNKLKSLMLRQMNEENPEWLSWFGESLPGVGGGELLSQQDDDLRNDPAMKDFLANHFGFGYLTQAFSKSTDDKIKAKFDALRQNDPMLDPKLSFFWKGDGDTSFSKSSAYSKATSFLMTTTYADVLESPFDFFMENNPVDWAKQLYDYCLAKPTLTTLALQNSTDGQRGLTHLCNMLHVLDPLPRITKINGKVIPYSTALYEQIMGLRLNEVVKFSELKNNDAFTEFMMDFVQQYFLSIQSGENWTDDTRTEATQQLKELMQHYRTEDVGELVKQIGSFVADAISVLIALNEGPLSKKINAFFNDPEMKAKYPYLTGFQEDKGFTIIRVVLSLGVYGFGIYQSVLAFLNWNNLTTEQKALAVVNIVNITTSLFNDLISLKAATDITRAGATADDLINAAGTVSSTITSGTPLLSNFADDSAVSADIELQDMVSPAMNRAGQAASVTLQAGGNTDEALESIWKSIAKITGPVAKTVAIIGLAGACVGAGFQIAYDFETGQPAVIKAFDILGEVANGIALVAEIGQFIAETISFIPIVGIVAAIVGVLISIIRMFLHENPPPTPQEVFIDEHCAPFISGLSIPSQDWIEKQKAFEAKSAASFQLVFA